MAEEEHEENAASRFGWFTAGVLTTLAAIALIVFVEDRLSSQAAPDTPGTIIEAH